MLKAFWVFLVPLLASPLAAAEIFKCTRDGNTVYQNFPCEIESIGSHATAKAPPDPPVTASPPVAQSKPSARVADATPSAGARTEPRIGMTKAQVKASTWGDPVDIVKEEVVEGWTETWYYDLGKKRSVVFGTNRRVSDVTP